MHIYRCGLSKAYYKGADVGELHAGCVIGAAIVIVPLLFLSCVILRRAHRNADIFSFWFWCKYRNKFICWSKDYLWVVKFVLIRSAILQVISILLGVGGAIMSLIGAALATALLFTFGAIIVTLPFIAYVVHDMRASKWFCFSFDLLLLALLVYVYYVEFGLDIGALSRAIDRDPQCVILGCAMFDVVRSCSQLVVMDLAVHVLKGSR